MSNCVCSIDVDCEHVDACSISKPVARKSHICVECGCEIKPREQYERTWTKYDDEITVYQTCLPCAEIRDCFFCSWMYSQVWEDLRVEWKEETDLFCIGSLAKLSAPARQKMIEAIDVWMEEEEK